MWETWGGAETKTALVGMGGVAGESEERHIGLDTENEWLPWKKSSLDSHGLRDLAVSINLQNPTQSSFLFKGMCLFLMVT